MPTAATWQRPPTWWARALIAASVPVLPRSARARYEEEFIADLYGMSRIEQARYTGHVLAGCVSLRLAVRSAVGRTSTLEGIDMTPRQCRPLRCRLNLHHDWHDESTDNGTRFQRCRRCGKDATGPVTTGDDNVEAIARHGFVVGGG
ncbi:MAG TPA: hypothetical protein VGH43_17780 [Jatrophihabitans sp.]|jgi:hypothetical protein